MRHPPVRAPYYGTPLYYRIEHRAGIKTLIVSYRDESNPRRPKLLYEMPPIGGKKLQPYIETDTPDDELLMTLPIQIMTEILQNWIGIQTDAGRTNRKNAPDLTLGILLVTDRSLLLHYTGSPRAVTSIRDDERVIDMLLARCGTLPWQSVTPRTCADWLSHQSFRRKKDIKRLMSHFEELQLKAGLLDQLTWTNYTPQETSRKRPSHKSCVQNQIENNKLTRRQCAEILEKIYARINNQTADGIDMAVIISLSCGLDYKHIAALDICDFSFLADYRSRLTVNVTQKLEKNHQNYRLHDLESPYARRKLPLPAIAADCYSVITARAPDPNTPLISDPRNKKHRLTPPLLRQAISERLASIQIRKVTDTPRLTVPSAVDMLPDTAYRGLLQCGLDTEELRMLRGQTPQLVSAKHYYDRANESALNKIGAIQDRWISFLIPHITTQNCNQTQITAANTPLTWVSPLPNHRTQILISLHIPPLPPESSPENGLTLVVHSLHGISGTISPQKEYKNAENQLNLPQKLPSDQLLGYV